MSQLRKSASFRSRIPIRRTRLPQRRCCSPLGTSSTINSTTNSNSTRSKRLNTKLRNSSNNKPQKSSSSSAASSQHFDTATTAVRRYSSSSSFSSSDESCESEAPLQILARKFGHDENHQNFYKSTDAISLDGLLDSVSSCGSFSSPPSPVQYQNTPKRQQSISSYESLDKYNHALEKLKITDNYNNSDSVAPCPVIMHRQTRNLQTSSETNLANKRHRRNQPNYDPLVHSDNKKAQINDCYYMKNYQNANQIANNQNSEQNGSMNFKQKTQSTNPTTIASISTEQTPAITKTAQTTDTQSVVHQNLQKYQHQINQSNLNYQHQQLQPDTSKYSSTTTATPLSSASAGAGSGSGSGNGSSDNIGLIKTQNPIITTVAANNLTTIGSMLNDTTINSVNIQQQNVNVKKSAYCYEQHHQQQQQNTPLVPNKIKKNSNRRDDNINFHIEANNKIVSRNIPMNQQQQQQQQLSTNSRNILKVENTLRTNFPYENREKIIVEEASLKSNDDTSINLKNQQLLLTNKFNSSSNKMNNHLKNGHGNGGGGGGGSNEFLYWKQKLMMHQYSNINNSNNCLNNNNNRHRSPLPPKQYSSNNEINHHNNNHEYNKDQIIEQHIVLRQKNLVKKKLQNLNGHCRLKHDNMEISEEILLKNQYQQQQQHEQHQQFEQEKEQEHLYCNNSSERNILMSMTSKQTAAAAAVAAASTLEPKPLPSETHLLHHQHINLQKTHHQIGEDEEHHHQFQFENLPKGINLNSMDIKNTTNNTRPPIQSASILTNKNVGLQQNLLADEQHHHHQQNQHNLNFTGSTSSATSNNFEQLNIIGIPTTNPYPLQQIYENSRIAWNEQFINSASGNSSTLPLAATTGTGAGMPITGAISTTTIVTNSMTTPSSVQTTKPMTELERKYLEAKRRPLPQLPLQDQIFPPKTSSSYRSDCELSGSYVSLECPSPPGPPTCLPESRRDPQARLSNYLKTFYTDLALKEPIIPQWAIPVAPGALSPARLEPEIHLNVQSHGFSDFILVDQLLQPVHTKEGTFLEAPRRVLIECPQWTSRSNISLRILHAWSREPPWPPKGTPVAVALLIPLGELKRSFTNYVEKELLVKGPLNPFTSGFGGFAAAWNSLESLGPKLLILLDGYDTQKGSPKRKGKHYPPDVHDLLDGKLFPEARVIITTSVANCTELLPLIQRHVNYEGLTWGRSASLLGGGQWGTAPSRLLDTVQECTELRKIVRTPLGCLAVAAIYEATAGDLPTEELDVIESVLNCVAPETSSINVAELGRLALFCLKMKRPCITVSEIRMYCSSPESSILGCLDKGLLLGKTAKKKAEFIYNPMCPGMAEFLAANYIASLANRPGLLAAEITGLSIGDELEPELLKVIKFAMGLLGPRAHILLSKLTPLWLTPQNIFSFALAGGSSEDNLSALCDIIGISKHPPISPLEAKPLWVQVRSAPLELMGWGMALKSQTCTLKNLELIYQLEKHILLDSRNAMETFLDSMDQNESVSTLRITSLIENEVKDAEISYLANCVSKALLKPRLESFELILTLLEEDPPILKLQPVIAALCRTIPRQTKLNCLQLDLGFSTSQLVQLCSTLDKCPNITRLSLPHLRCERGAISALASLLAVRPMSFLALPSCWGARDDPPSSSGVSMGSGSGSSTGTSGLIKQGSLTGVPSPRSYPPGLFSSLPRGMYVPTATMGRSATLPRQPIEPPADKRSCDSVVSKTWFPTPACDGGPHNSGTLHDLLLAAREPYSKLHGLDLSKAQLSLEDSMCLGETVRLSNTLHTLKLEGSSRLSEILPSVLGASESPCLQMLSIGSPRLNLEDSAIGMSARSLTSCSTLRLLSLDGWNFRIENPSTLSILRAFLSLTSIRELSLANCRLQIGIFKSDTKIINSYESRSVVVLKLASAQALLADSTILRGPQLLPFIGGFPCLRELDISAPARSGLGSTTHSSPFILDDKCLINFFQSLHTYFSLLNTLKLCNWVIHFDDPGKTLKSLSKCIRNSPISHLKMDGISVLDRTKKLRIESQFFHSFISSLPLLRWMGISLSGKKEDQITAIGNAVLDLKGYEIDIKLSESTIEHAKLMAQAISLDGKFDIKVSTFGTSSGILIHAEKSGTKSLNRKHKE